MTTHISRTLGICVSSPVVTRFPPEPSGFLHIGHIKAMVADFGLAEENSGKCILRFDDTNPDTETQAFADAILQDVLWLNFQPSAVTYTSDYFEELYNSAIQLVTNGGAYVCHLTVDETKRSRRAGKDSDWRDTSVEENLTSFSKMRSGDLSSAVLRLKTDDHHDPIAYRSKSVPHFRTGTDWCIYPSYEMSHPIVDSLEGITHSLCSKEFEEKRERYYWLLDKLHIFKPAVHEFSRLKMPDALISKRDIASSISSGDVQGWDDPLLLTVRGLKRRGVPPESIVSFCKDIGVTNTDSVMSYHNLMHHIRQALNLRCPRVLAVMTPLKVQIVNLPMDDLRPLKADKYPQEKANHVTYDMKLSSFIWISSDDFQRAPTKSFWGLAPGKQVLLKYAFVVECIGFSESEGEITEVQVKYLPALPDKLPKGVISWVSEEDCVRVRVKELPEYGDFTSAKYFSCTANREIIKYEGSREVFQIERRGYYIHDDTLGCFTRTCGLKGSKSRTVPD